jgi:hypothetical protein
MRTRSEHSKQRSVSHLFIFDPIAVLRALTDYDVDFVLIGGVAQGAHGSAYPTYDVDIAIDGRRENIERLSRALASLGAAERPVDGGVVETQAGAVDVTVFSPEAKEYSRLAADAMAASVENRQIRIASIDHLIAMREQRSGSYDPLLSLELRVLADEERRQS